MTEKLCIYHGNCDDGFGAAFAVWKALGDQCEYHAGVYQNPPPNVYGKEVYIVDFSYKLEPMMDICRRAASVTILDHHDTASRDLAGIFEWARQNGLKVDGQFDMERSGAMMAWQHFHSGEKPPLFFEYIQDRDLFRKKLPYSNQFTIALRSYPQDFRVWQDLEVERLISEGKHIWRYYEQRVQDVVKTAWMENIGGFEVPVANAPYAFASEVAGALCEGHPFAACYFITDGYENYSLRSAPGMVHVGNVAKEYGGGGHPHAAGFKIKRGQSK